MTHCRCTRPLRAPHTICDTCTDQLTQALNTTPWLVTELNTTITRQRATPTEGGSASAEKPLPWHEKASNALRDLKATLAAWAKFCEDEHIPHQSPRTRPLDHDDDNPTALARWLLWRVDGLSRHNLGPDAVDEIATAVDTSIRMIDVAPSRWYAGPCTTQTDDEAECGADLYARRTDGTVTCHSCGTVHDVALRREWLLAEAEDRLADATTIARAVSWLGAEPLTAARVRKWAERGRIVAHGHDGRRPLYRIGDAIDLLAADTTRTTA